MENRQYECGPGGWRGQRFFNTPPVNITETKNEYILNLYAPSLTKENITVTTQNDILTIRYKPEENSSSKSFTRREYCTDEIERSFDLKGKVDTDGIKAAYAEGILKIELPKTDSAKKPAQEVSVS